MSQMWPGYSTPIGLEENNRERQINTSRYFINPAKISLAFRLVMTAL